MCGNAQRNPSFCDTIPENQAVNLRTSSPQGFKGNIMESIKARVLHAEDNADDRDLVSFILKTNDCEWVGAATFDEALRLAQEGGFNLFLLDNWLPDVSGVHLCKKIRDFDKTT